MSLSLVILLLLFAGGLIFVLGTMIRHDGNGRFANLGADHHPPRSHVPDTFDPAVPR